MKLVSSSFQNNGAIPGEYAFCVMDPVKHVAMSRNCNPPLSWSEVPAGVRSFVLLCHDYDVPSVGGHRAPGQDAAPRQPSLLLGFPSPGHPCR